MWSYFLTNELEVGGEDGGEESDFGLQFQRSLSDRTDLLGTTHV